MPSETCLTTFIRAALLVGILYACKLPGTVAARRYTLSNLSAYSNIMEEDTRELNPSFGLNYHSSKCVFKGFFRQPGAYACWSEWGPWSICTKPCSGGMRTRHRKCETSQTEGIWCIDKGFEMQVLSVV
ncbi:unnamed protein product [Soboliphyme baturini]|uniref:Kringle domain-containing protein n=1 Tax=Soboliphyme baturini TaxID=241478 RepID=A0A183IEW5_9BILA|nr:unnamed protein product [Soboliphyme baturini]